MYNDISNFIDELKTPVTNINLCLELLKSSKENDHIFLCLKIISRNINKLNTLSEQNMKELMINKSSQTPGITKGA